MKLRHMPLIMVVAASVALTGCASWTQQCNAKVAYNDGVTDGSTQNTPKAANYAEACLKKKQAALNAAYENGYNVGLQQRVNYKSN